MRAVRALVLVAALEEARPADAQPDHPLRLRAGALGEAVAIDGRLDEES